MSTAEIFIKNIIDAPTSETITAINSLKIIDVFDNQKGGARFSDTDSFLATSNDSEFGKKKTNKKTKNSLFKTRKVRKNKDDIEDDDSESESISSSSSFEDSMDSTSISSDTYPLFNYYGQVKKNKKTSKKSKKGRISNSKNPRKQVGGTRVLRNEMFGGGDMEVVRIGKSKPFLEKKGALHQHLKVSESYRFSKSTLNRLAKIPIGETFNFQDNEIKMTRKIKAEVGLAKAFETMRKDKKKDKRHRY